jgi:leucyl-tRNA synthetase
MRRYNPKEIEPRWQKTWLENKTFEVREDGDKPKKYIIDMFPYPSGAAMHVGHVRNFTISDVLSQFHRQKGYNVMHTMGWDTFGLPAENYAIKTGTPPAETTKANIANFKHQLQQLGMSYDWSREVNTSDPAYYKWTQWIFMQLFEHGLAYQKESAQWWCPHDKTVLANEQVENGRCWRCGNEVVKKNLKQWFFKITDYADALLDGIDDLDWPEKIKTMQRNWIGRSKGASIKFKVESSEEVVEVFTTRPDTIFGATFLVLAPEHERVAKITTADQKSAVETYVKAAQKKSEIERQENKEKTGVFTGAYAVNPANNEKIPVWIADYVLMGYGTGAIMAVPAHDERDNEFAKKFDLPITEVVVPDYGELLQDAQPVEGVVVIVYDQKSKKFLGVTTGTNQGIWLNGGGREGEETFAENAVRELREETGFREFDAQVQLGGPVYSYYFNDVKRVAKRSFGQGFLFFVDADKRGEPEPEEHEKKFKLDWYDFDALYKGVETVGGGVGHWLEMLRRARAVVDGQELEPYHGEGLLRNSGDYDGMPTGEAREKIVADLEKQGVASEKVQYKMRDWLISRQRYWGAPIPIIHCPKDGPVAVPEQDLPVVLPEVENFAPTGEGSVLASATEWVNTTCPKCGGPAKRETDTMDGYACSSWYFLRYADPHNDKRAWDPAVANYWLPVDYYCGGDHAVSHLLYSRFWFHFFADRGWIEKTRREPVGKLVYNGYILAPDGTKMSKSKGNTINPDDLIEQGYGADSVRLFEMFIAPYEQNTSWNTSGVPGTYRFLQRVWTLVQEFDETDGGATDSPKLERLIHKTIKKVTDDLENLSFNTAVAALMECVNELYKLKAADNYGAIEWQWALESLVQLLAPFAPHIAEELWQQLGGEGSVHVASWPVFDEKYLTVDTVTLAVQLNGKVRAQVTVSAGADEAAAKKAALVNDHIKELLNGKEPKRVIYVPGRLVNIVV